MPATIALTEDTVHRIAPDAAAVQAGRGLLRKRSFKELAVSPDGTWLLAKCQGSGKEPYEVSVDLAADAPVGRCTCPSRKLPCKHALGLMLAFLDNPSTFTEQAPPAELTAKRDKQAARAQQQAEGKPAAPRKVNKAALEKKTAAQREGLDLLEKLMVDLVAAGQWFERSRLERLQRQAKQMNDAYLPGARIMLNRLALLGWNAEITEEEKLARASDLITRLWATVQKGRNYLDNKLAGDENQAEADAVIEEVLGKAWQLSELKEKGYVRENLTLLELAYERTDDPAREERVETSHLLELTDGTVYQAIAYRPFRGMNQIAGQPSYAQTLSIREAAVYPGFLNRRVRWEKGAELSHPVGPAELRKAYHVAAAAFEPVLAAFRQQLKHLLAPREAVVLVRCQNIGRVGERTMVEDAKGARIGLAGDTHGANLVRVAGMLHQPAVLLRLFVNPLTNTITAQPLAALTNEHHLRLGL